MKDSSPWILPDGLEESLPVAARRLEKLRRKILDQFDVWGYDLVFPPMAEFLESLLTGVGQELDLQTFTFTDPISGRLLGIPADLTPQVARMDAHRLDTPGTQRLCYVGPVMRTYPDEWSRSRSPLQAGAEIFGHDGLDSDVEIIRLLLATLDACHVPHVSIDLGHVGIYRGLARVADLSSDQESTFFQLLQRKAVPEIEEYLYEWDLDPVLSRALSALVDLNGGPEVLEIARTRLAAVWPTVSDAIEHLQAMVTCLHEGQPDLDIHVDLAELRGYSYHTGLVFAAFVPGSGQEIARGGRYNEIGRVFGRSRAATGFSTDLRALMKFAQIPSADLPLCVVAPVSEDPALDSAIDALRAQGVRVRKMLEGETLTLEKNQKQLVQQDGQWQISVDRDR